MENTPAFNFAVTPVGSGCTITITRNADGMQKTFTQSSINSMKSMNDFMSSITDQQLSEYFPKQRKQ